MTNEVKCPQFKYVIGDKENGRKLLKLFLDRDYGVTKIQHQECDDPNKVYFVECGKYDMMIRMELKDSIIGRFILSTNQDNLLGNLKRNTLYTRVIDDIPTETFLFKGFRQTNNDDNHDFDVVAVYHINTDFFDATENNGYSFSRLKDLEQFNNFIQNLRFANNQETGDFYNKLQEKYTMDYPSLKLSPKTDPTIYFKLKLGDKCVIGVDRKHVDNVDDGTYKWYFHIFYGKENAHTRYLPFNEETEKLVNTISPMIIKYRFDGMESSF